MPSTASMIVDPESSVWTWFSPDSGPMDGATVLTDRWWVVHPEKGLPIFKGTSPQCNSNERITRMIAKSYPWAEVRFLPVAYYVRNDR
jgi:ligand-binding SRPBCC domain-containing protein